MGVEDGWGELGSWGGGGVEDGGSELRTGGGRLVNCSGERRHGARGDLSLGMQRG